MGSLNRRVGKLEARSGARPPAKPPGPTPLDEIRAIEKEIANIEAEMRAAGMSEAEIRASYADLSKDEELALIEEEIARIKAERS